MQARIIDRMSKTQGDYSSLVSIPVTAFGESCPCILGNVGEKFALRYPRCA